MSQDLCFSPAADRNKQPLFEILEPYFRDSQCILEIGTRSAQHALYFTSFIPDLDWVPSEIPENLKDLEFCLGRTPHSLLPIETLDVTQKSHWKRIKSKYQVDLIFTANTFHIMPFDAVDDFWYLGSKTVLPQSKIAVYGPFFDHSKEIAASNLAFDKDLKSRIPGSGIRDLEDIKEMAKKNGFELKKRFQMPANNEVLLFER